MSNINNLIHNLKKLHKEQMGAYTAIVTKYGLSGPEEGSKEAALADYHFFHAEELRTKIITLKVQHNIPLAEYDEQETRRRCEGEVRQMTAQEFSTRVNGEVLDENSKTLQALATETGMSVWDWLDYIMDVAVCFTKHEERLVKQEGNTEFLRAFWDHYNTKVLDLIRAILVTRNHGGTKRRAKQLLATLPYTKQFQNSFFKSF
jgi:hypothetical protein